MIMPLAGKKVLVMGLGRFGGGVGVAKFLVQQGAVVTVTDAQPAADLADSIKALAGLPINFKLGGHDLDDFLSADLLVINPAVDKQKNPIVQQALAQKIPFTTELNLFLERNPALTIGITGSVGKSTTSSLIYEALKAGVMGSQLPVPGSQSKEKSPTDNREAATGNPSAPRVFLGGNIGKSLLLDLPNIRATDIVVLELSSFMLEDTPAIGWSPNIALVTNVFANHLDRHDTLANYAAAKQNILRFQHPGDAAILNGDHDLVARWVPLAQKSGATVMKYTTRGPHPIQLVLPGEHNQSNAKAAIAVLDALEARGVPLNRAAALTAIQNFAGLAHRLQLVHTLTLSTGNPLRFYNDSKATSPDAAITAVRAFPDRSAIFLVGGYDKHIDLSPFENLLAQHAGAVIGIGQTGAVIVEHVRAIGAIADNRLVYAESLERAIPLASGWAGESPVLTAVVLSPASASYGQFLNYEMRGDTFTRLARQLGSSGPSPALPA